MKCDSDETFSVAEAARNMREPQRGCGNQPSNDEGATWVSVFDL
jgi:hypothetical protein